MKGLKQIVAGFTIFYILASSPYIEFFQWFGMVFHLAATIYASHLIYTGLKTEE